ncbi:hypothetical protein N9B73_09040 [Verrucomicrobiales bacterium]|nr:hypothetical protein [Verrucomicrobiales bacterium]
MISQDKEDSPGNHDLGNTHRIGKAGPFSAQCSALARSGEKRKLGDLFIVGSRTLSKEDLTGSFLLSAMTIFVATLTEVARAHGLSIHHRLDQIPNPNVDQDRIPFGALHLEPLQAKDEAPRYPLELIEKRKTSRLPSWRKPVLLLTQEALTSFCSDCGQRLCILSDPHEIEWAIEKNISALFEDLNTPDYHDEGA